MRLGLMLLTLLILAVLGIHYYSYDPGVAEGPYRKRIVVVTRAQASR